MDSPKLFDIHSHLNFSRFDEDREEVIKRMRDNGIWTVCVGVDKKTSREAIKLAEKYDEIFAAVGLHPTEDLTTGFSSDEFEKLARHPKVVAIGECGLDYYRIENQPAEAEQIRQKEVFARQIELAIKINKPLMVHCRSAHGETLEILSSYEGARGDIHFFSGAWEQARKYFDLGFSISFAGPITFADEYDEVIKKSPLDKIMAETDSPFASPAPHRGKRGEPLFVKEVVKKIAQVRGISYEEAAEAATRNALNFF
ncbi:MAG TPA: TatD family deoxyribonuclease, partial [bacterium]|nr:TatD family deoxyribonuclease [bacterium]